MQVNSYTQVLAPCTAGVVNNLYILALLTLHRISFILTCGMQLVNSFSLGSSLGEKKAWLSIVVAIKFAHI